MTGHYKQTLLLLSLIGWLLLSGCANYRVASSEPQLAHKAFDTEMAEAKAGRLLIWRGSLTVEVDQVQDALPAVYSIVEKRGGHVENKWLSGNGKERASLKIRVPSKEVNATLDEISRLGNEKRRHVSSEDVTEQFIDTESRLKNAVALRDRLRALLSKAKEVKEIIDIERELTRIQSDIDSMEGRLKSLKGQIDLASIDLTLEEKTILGPLGYIFKGISWVIKKLFVIK